MPPVYRVGKRLSKADGEQRLPVPRECSQCSRSWRKPQRRNRRARGHVDGSATRMPILEAWVNRSECGLDQASAAILTAAHSVATYLSARPHKESDRVKITYDPTKRIRTLALRELDFEDAREVFAGRTVDFIDDRNDYGEVRWITAGRLRGRIVMVVWTARHGARQVISMRKANGREQETYGRQLGS